MPFRPARPGSRAGSPLPGCRPLAARGLGPARPGRLARAASGRRRVLAGVLLACGVLPGALGFREALVYLRHTPSVLSRSPRRLVPLKPSLATLTRGEAVSLASFLPRRGRDLRPEPGVWASALPPAPVPRAYVTVRCGVRPGGGLTRGRTAVPESARGPLRDRWSPFVVVVKAGGAGFGFESVYPIFFLKL